MFCAKQISKKKNIIGKKNILKFFSTVVLIIFLIELPSGKKTIQLNKKFCYDSNNDKKKIIMFSMCLAYLVTKPISNFTVFLYI